jgi:hypothetical protein
MKATVFGAPRDPNKNSLTTAIIRQLASQYEVQQVSAEGSTNYNEVGQVLVITAYPPKSPFFQEAEFKKAFSLLRDTDTHIVLIGSCAHHFETGLYGTTKRRLHDAFYNLGKNQSTYKCKLTLIEPGQCRTVRGKEVEGPFLEFHQVNTTMMFALNHNPKFMHIALQGVSY